MATQKGLSKAVVQSLQGQGITGGRLKELTAILAELEGKGIVIGNINPVGTPVSELQMRTIVDEAGLQALVHTVSSGTTINDLRILSHGIPPAIRQFIATFSA